MNTHDKKTILLVEDEAELNNVITKILAKFGYNVISVYSGKEAVELVEKNEKIDLILMDINLGSGIDGTEAARQILLINDIPVVFHTSHPEQEMVEKVKGITRYGYVIKNSGNFVLQSSLEMAFELFEANKTIHKREKLFRGLFNNSLNAVALIELIYNEEQKLTDGIVIEINKAFERCTGLQNENVKGKLYTEVYPDVLKTNNIQRLDELLKKGEPYISEVFYKPTEKFFNFTAHEIDKGLVAIVLEDITGEKLAIQSLIDREVEIKSLQLLHQVTDKIPVSIICIRVSDLCCRFVNQVFADVFSIPVEQIEGMHIKDILGYDTYSRALPNIERACEGERISCEYKFQVNSEMRFFSIDYIPHIDEGEEIKYLIILAIDITRSKLAAQALRESEEKYRQLFNVESDAIFLYDCIDNKIIDVNPAALEMYGYIYEEFLLLKPADISNEPEKTQKAIADKEKHIILRYHKKKDGTIFPVEITGNYFILNNREVHVAAIRDITERIKAEEELKQSESLFRLLAENSTDMISRHDLEGTYLYVSSACRTLLGYEPEELIGHSSFEFIHPDSISVVDKSRLSIIEQPILSTTEFNIRCKNGEYIWLETTSKTIIDNETGAASEIHAASRDITKRKKVEEKLLKEMRFSKDVIDNVADGICVCHNTAEFPFVKFTVWNNRMTEITGYTMDDINRKGWYQTLYPDPELQMKAIERMSNMRQGDDISREEWLITRADQAKRILCISTSIINSEDGTVHVLALMQDITDRRKSEEKIKSLLAEKELILKEVHHRLKNNMNTVSSLLTLQAMSLNDPLAISALQDTKSRVDSMVVLYDKLYCSDNFKDISFLVYLPPLIDEIVSNFPGSESVNIVKEIDDFIIDLKKLQPLGIIINELLTNIMKYAFTGRDNKMITVSATLTDKRVSIIISDNGSGIPESITFENSTGFGMQLVSMLTEQIGGSIRIERERERERESGSRFILEFDLR